MKVKNLALEKYKEHVFRCYKCAYCVDTVSNYSFGGPIPPRGRDGVCLIYRQKKFDHYTARGRLSIAQALLQGELSYSPGLIETTYMCLTCKNCVEQCMGNPETPGMGIDICSIVEAMRSDIVEEGLAPDKVKKIASRIRVNHNLFGREHEKRTEWTKGLGLPPKADTILFSGCYSSYITQEGLKSAIKILKKAKIDFTILKDEWCCGSPLLNLGFRELAREIALHNIERLNEIDAKRVIFLCPHCYKTFKTDYIKIAGNLPLEVIHITEFMETIINTGELKLINPIPKKVTYHDPCHLGRYCRVYEQPRKILNAIPGLKLIEMYPNRENTWCCGTGSTFRFLYGDLAANIASQKVNRIDKMGVDALVSACPACQVGFTIGIKKTGSHLESYDLTQLVAQSIEK